MRGKVGRPRRRPDRVTADRGYDHDKYRRELRQRRIKPEIARRQTDHGSGLGRPAGSSNAPSPGSTSSSGYSFATTAAPRSTRPSSRSPAASSASGESSTHCDSSSDMEQRVKGAARLGLSSRPRAAERPEQRRWIRLTFAGRDGMTGVRRELPRSKVAGHRRAVPHRALEGSPCGRTHPLLKVEGWIAVIGQVLRSGCSVAIAQTKPASSRAQATTIFCRGLPRPAIRCQRW